MSGADLLVTGAALLAALVARRSVARAAEGSPPAARLRTVFSLAAALLALRLLVPVAHAVPLGVALMLVAAWLPFAGLRFAEELARRHAARPVKLAALGGALGFSGVAVTLGVVWSAAAMAALAAYQALMLAMMVRHLWAARGELAAGERRAVDTILMALLVTIPLAITDFTALFPDLPVRGGAFAVLLLVLATSGLVAGRGTPWRLVGDLLVIAGAGGVLALVGAGVSLAAGGAAVAGLVLLIERLGAADVRRSGLLAALAGVEGDDVAAIVSAHPLLASGRILGAAELAGYPPASLARLFDHVLVTAEIDDADTRAAGRDLLDAAGATHLLRISRDPPRLLAVAGGALASPTLDDELAVAARLIGRAA